MKREGVLVHHAPAQYAGLGPLPVRVRTKTGEIVGMGVTGLPITVPEGSYYITMCLPDGSEVGADSRVRATPGGVPAMAGDAPPPAPSAPLPVAAMIAPAPEAAADHVTLPASIWRGDWLVEWGRGVPVLDRPTTADLMLSSVEPSVIPLEDGGDRLLVLPLADRIRCSVIPYDECPVCIDDRPEARAISARLGPDFNLIYRSLASDETNGLLGFVEGGLLTSMVAVTEDAIHQGKEALADASGSVLSAITGSYVLLRANALDGLERWLDQLEPHAATLPDLLPLRAELYARLGDHARAVAVMRAGLAKRRCPWFRAGLTYMQERVRLYIDVTENGNAAFALNTEDYGQFQKARDALEIMLPTMLTSQYIATFDLPIRTG